MKLIKLILISVLLISATASSYADSTMDETSTTSEIATDTSSDAPAPVIEDIPEEEETPVFAE